MSRLAESLGRSGADVEVLSLNPRKHGVASANRPPVAFHAIDIDTSRTLGPAIHSLLRGTPYIVERFVSSRFREALRLTLRRFQPDIVQVESPFLLDYVATVREESRALVVLRSLNVEFRIWTALAEIEGNPLRRFALDRIASSLRRYEVRNLDTPDALVAISAADAADFCGLGCTLPVHVAPCGIALTALDEDRAEPHTAGFIGSLDFRPNQEAVKWIVDELWPRVMTKEPRARLEIGGSSPPKWLQRRARGQSIDFRGHVDDAAGFMRRMSVVIAPLFAGGGMRIKVLEAMALARPVVATTLGAGGIEVEDEENIFIANDPASFADRVAQLFREPATAARIGKAARTSVAARYDSDTIARELLRFYESL